MALASEQVVCDWPDTDDNQIRRKFCSRHHRPLNVTKAMELCVIAGLCKWLQK